MNDATGWARRLRVSGDGKNLVSHAGAGVVRLLAERTGLTGAFSAALARAGFLPVHDRGQVFTDISVAIADGESRIGGIEVLGQSAELYGPVASVPTAWRCLNEIGPAQLDRLQAAKARIRRHVWTQIEARHGALPGVRVADRQVTDMICVRLDATVVPAHSDKQGAEPNFKGFGHHPLLAFCDNTREPLAELMRPGSAGSNTAADHIALTDAAIRALPARHRRRLMVTVDGAGASHDLVDHLATLAERPGHRLWYWIGWEYGARERTAIGRVPATAWQTAIDAHGDPRTGPVHDTSTRSTRSTRSGDHKPELEDPELPELEDKAQVVELTALLRDTDGKGTDALTCWPADLRVYCRRERPHPGAQLSLFEQADGWRYQLWCTNAPDLHPRDQNAWLARPAYSDACYRMQARVEDRIRTGKDTGLGAFPSHSYAINTAWLAAASTAAMLLAWLAHLALDGDLAKAEPKTIRHRLLHLAARLTHGARRTYLKIDETWPWVNALVTAYHRIQTLPQAP
jgi:hypothetical protein